jgi:hypothetical protein
LAVDQITIVETVDGSYTGLLLTSTAKTGSYEVVAVVNSPHRKDSDLVTVVCAPPEATANPDVATVPIKPPSTGDAGLVSPSGDNALLLVIVATLAVPLADFVALRFGRR